ncbi:MAG: alpha/beta hydrolase, partial [Chloroflexi bacterium]|nr:alpha/beta hydrolase [Chloroflexota bacterium]
LITDDLYHLLKGLNIEKTILLGHSMGGEVVLRFNQSHPDMTGGLIISNSILGAIRTISDIQNNMTNPDNESNQPVMQDINERIARFFSPGILDRKPEVIEEFKEMALRNKSLRNKPGRSPQNGMIGLLMKTPINNLNKIICPTLIIYGKYDFLVKPNMPKSVSNTIPNLHVKTLPTGHYPFLEMPDEYNKIILNFLKEAKLLDAESSSV